MSILNKLNHEQKSPAEVINGPMLILAGAGSGKTRTVTHRIAYMVKEKQVNPNNILAMTFTNKATKEMKDRIAKLIDNNVHSNQITVTTIHSFGVKMIKKYLNKTSLKGNFTIFDDRDSKSIISEIIEKENWITMKPDYIKSLISYFKEFDIRPKDIGTEHQQNIRLINKVYLDDFKLVYEMYQKELQNNNALDFGDILLKTYELLKNEDVLNEIQDKYKYITVDEYQDTNAIQYKIVKKIASKYKNLCVVGDEDQSIYGFRGADIKNILSFEKDYPEAKIFKLEQNYRSTKKIVNSATSLVKINETSKKKNLWTENNDGDPIIVKKCNDNKAEAIFVVDEIKQRLRLGLKPKDFTILYRNNALSRSVEEFLIKANIPYTIIGGTSFYQRKEIKDALAYIKIFINPSDALSFSRICEVPKKGIGKTTIKNLSEYAKENNMQIKDIIETVITKNIKTTPKAFAGFVQLYEIFKNLEKMVFEKRKVVDIIEYVIKNTGILKYYTDNDDNENRALNLNELHSAILSITEEKEIETLEDLLDEITLMTNEDPSSNKKEDKIEGNFVKLMSIHASKGLEFPNVFLIGAEDGLLPSDKADSVEEERRLMYVAMTRAEHQLFISYCKTRFLFGETVISYKSPFIDEIPKENVLFL